MPIGLRFHPIAAFCDSGKPYAGRPDIIGIYNGNPKKKSIIFNGHVSGIVELSDT
jgi:hypothetical protein